MVRRARDKVRTQLEIKLGQKKPGVLMKRLAR